MFNLNLRQKKRHILHIDADAFFASVEQLVNPKLANKPVLVGGPDNGRGIVAAASYEARRFGIKSAMPMYLAKKKCPQAIVVSGNFRLYREYSQKIRKVMQSFTPDVEMASIDEAYLDITGCLGGDYYSLCRDGLGEMKKRADSAKDFALQILWEIYRQTGLSVSCGLASSKMVAKVASSLNKPRKFTAVPYGKEREFLAPLHLNALPGIGPNTASLLKKFGFEKIGDLAELGLTDVLKILGVRGIGLWKRAQGFDDSMVDGKDCLPKSISKEHTFYNAVFTDGVGIEECTKLLRLMLKQVLFKLRSKEMKAGKIFIKIRYQDFEDFGAQKVVETASSSDFYLFPLVKDLFLSRLEKGRRIRLVGVGVGNLARNYNLTLFNEQEKDDTLMREIDKLSQRFGLERVYN